MFEWIHSAVQAVLSRGGQQSARNTDTPQVFEPLESRQMLSAGAVLQDDVPAVEGPAVNYAMLNAVLRKSGIAQPTTTQVTPTAKAPAASTAKPAAAAASTSTPIVYSGPITITKGGTYRGNWQSLNADVPAVRVRTDEPVIIENSNIRSRGACIDVYGYDADVMVRNVRATGLNPNKKWYQPGRFLDVDGFVNLRVYNNYAINTAGIYVYAYQGNHTAAQSIKIQRNQIYNVDGRYSNGANGWIKYTIVDDYRQAIQLNGLRDMVGVDISWNQIINRMGQSRVEENFNIHDTTGTANSPIRIHDNYIEGSYPADAMDLKKYTGGGIMLSDNGSSYIWAYNNHLVATGTNGVIVTSGHDNKVFNNRIVSSGLLPDGSTAPWWGTGAVIWNYNNEPTFYNQGGYGNIIGWVTNGNRNDTWMPDADSWENNRAWPGAITAKVQANEWTVWRNKLTNKSVKVGPTA